MILLGIKANPFPKFHIIYSQLFRNLLIDRKIHSNGSENGWAKDKIN